MNVILDANILLEDVHQKSNRFTSFYAFMRRTSSTLVIPNLVLEEVIERRRRTLRDKVEKLQNAADEVRQLLVNQQSTIAKTEKIFSAKINIDQEIELLRQKLLNPAIGIRVVHAEETLDIKDVYRRGIARKRPANEKGEELRDVIVWLSVLQCAKAGSAVAFVSRDSGFWEESSGGLHPDIASDVSSSGLDIRVYRDLDGFSRANALNSTPWSADEIKQQIDVTSLNAQIIEKVKGKFNGIQFDESVVAFRSASVISASFESGTLYEVESGTKFGEVAFRAYLTVLLALTPKPRIPDYWLASLTSDLSGSASPLVSGLSGMRQLPEYPRVDETEVSLRVPVTGVASIRIVNSKIETAEVDTVHLENPNAGQP